MGLETGVGSGFGTRGVRSGSGLFLGIQVEDYPLFGVFFTWKMHGCCLSLCYPHFPLETPPIFRNQSLSGRPSSHCDFLFSDTIFVRVYEARMELLRAVIIGPPGTPYHDGLFVFDCLFPTDYPNSPPMVFYYSGGLRLNPNLYDCGKVCLSLLGTWSGRQRENWIPGESTMLLFEPKITFFPDKGDSKKTGPISLRVLVSIQALILNADPFFNEPGYETRYTGVEGQKKSRKYSEEVFIMSLKTMMYTLRKPPKYFEDFVLGHFRNRAHNILAACKAYSEGTLVGSSIGDAVQNGVESGSSEFKSSVARMMNMLVTYFTRNGSTDCEQFRGAA
ncbi:putative ubiquitin-conjugating enzyme E2 38 [Rosa rugosa]|uniref:putative ubiquitin-conjugating enzyme E2 38 n=1 Tax=Rosa rugosa TaxID=74645 RepID=UPI002B4031CB|nr:putative ubiquitin-conjugating enzyme E2 38 [Rosa rugosa]